IAEHQREQIDDHLELERVRDAIRGRQHDEADEHLHRASPVDDQQHAIDREAHDRNLDGISPSGMQQLELFENAHVACASAVSFRIAQATSSASRVGLTSCTRKIRAPRASAATFAPTEPATRADGVETPVSSPMKRFRETPTSTGN